MMKQKILSAGVVIVRPAHKDCYLLLRSYHYWDFPKGHVEPGETPLTAACREVQEETSLAQIDFLWGHNFLETPPYGPGKVARYYVAQTRTDEVTLLVNPTLGFPEHHEFRWLDFEQAKTIVAPRLRPILHWAHDITGY